MSELAPLPSEVLPAGIRARFVSGINGLRMHILEAGSAAPGRPVVLLLHGFPELAYSWRKIMPTLAAAGFHVVAPDQRWYGRTTGWSANYDDDLRPFRLLNAVRDALGLVAALGYRSVASVVGHDFGASIAAWCALVRPDVFQSVTLMSAPFPGPPDLPFDTERHPPEVPASPTIHEALAALPRPRKHYQWWYSTRSANAQMWHCRQGVHDFLRAYFHHKSADWKDNRPHRLAAWSAEELAKMPTYYIMDLADDMPTAVAKEMPSPQEIAACRSPPAAGSRTKSWRSIPASTGASDFRAASSRARVTGASISGRERSSACRIRPAPASPAATCSTAPGTGYSKSRRLGSANCFWTF